MIHYLYIGHFERDGSFIRFEKVGETRPALYRPVVQRPLNPSILGKLLRGWHTEQIPGQWGMAVRKAGYIVWDRFCGNDDATDFVLELANLTKCDLADYSSLTLLSVDELERATNRSV